MARTYTTAECAAAAKNLAAAQDAKRALALGEAVARIREGDKDIEFRATNLDLLLAYTREQQAIVDTCAGCRRTPTGSFRFIPS